MYNKYISQHSQIIGLRYEYVTNEDMKCSRLNFLKLLTTQGQRSSPTIFVGKAVIG